MKHSANPQRVAIAPSCHWLWIRKVATAIAMTLVAGAVCLWIQNDRSRKALAADALATNPSLTPVSVSWTGLPLRQVADRLSELARQPIIVDRRLDPDTRITLNVTQQPLADVLLSVAKLAHAERAMLGSWMRLCPTGQAAALEAARIVRSAEMASLPAACRTLAAKRHKWSWPEGASPRDLLFAAATEGGIALDGIPAIPHDHFPAASLPPLSLADRLDLLLAHFDRRVAWKKRPSPAGKPDLPWFEIVALPSPSLTAATSPAGVIGRTNTGSQPLRQTPPALFSLRVEAPLEEVLTAVAQRLGLTLWLDRESLKARGIMPAEIVRLTINDVTQKALLDAIVDPLALDWEIQEKQLRVKAREVP